MARLKEIPLEIMQSGPIESTCVDYWFSDSLGNKINKLLPDGWKFVSHSICERDSFGPVTSLLIVKDSNNEKYEVLI
jgi:hypothetical protein